MSESSTVEAPATPSRAVKLPPGPRLPMTLQGLAFIANRRWTVYRMARRYGEAFSLNIPIFGPTVVVAEPQLAKQVFTANTDDLGNVQPNLSRVLGPGSVFALDGAEHRRRRRLLTPPFHGKSVKNYEKIFEEETLRESANWPEGQAFETLEPMMRITLNAILRAVFGADGERLDDLRRIIPPWVTLGSRVVSVPTPKRTYGRYSPWGRLARYRRQYDAVINRLIDDVTADPGFDDRNDVLALLLRSTYEDGSVMTRQEIGDELLTLLAAGHETTAATLAWAFERITRHPEVLAKLVEEAQTDDNDYRQATILEVQRNRTIIDFAGRHVYSPTFELGEWVIPQGHTVLTSILLMHDRADEFPAPQRFDPQRFLGNRPSTFAWIPFGGGTRRCVGAVFANVEMDVVLRTVLRHFAIETTTAPGEKWHSRGVAFTPKHGGRMVVHRRG
ncbi:cytochrome P450 [Mycolicibacterium holsaticum]|uniref:cytochrome P450 n=1 Tax=Mycolicibacterium holsaticum TaxID=152142 RepID=UPI001C7CADE5|nr:cytochrome P450 [Mycolicibacterium holsaticum]MDA4108836.1 cytochrome P450 [Mycolicibacterium holsaticum DSM 44478 = JCM 12374]QZA12464.1 cytochrome P450 [Mycolicibacterium holsaticum DSM 44478 = JCM 12374]UNC10054.1 cytochrome P450 [Mycolicibacterium holsaticum DSM 44478 = JCM 12374]